jgi:enoyl-CoA hydratase
VVLAEPFTPAEAVEAGFLDRVVDPASLDAAARTAAEALAALDMASHVATKQRARGPALEAIRAGIAADWSSFRRSA